MSRVNLEATASRMVCELAAELGTLDFDELREQATDRAHEEADNACIYYSACMDLISDYESDPRARDADADSGDTFPPSEWQRAMQIYAYYIACAVIGAEASEFIDALEESADDLIDALHAEGVDVGADNLAITTRCPHGWAPQEKIDGMLNYWHPRDLEGCRAIAIETACDAWLSFTWTPERAEPAQAAR